MGSRHRTRDARPTVDGVEDFSGASTAFGASPNSQASAVDIALPGVLPALNKGAVERAIRFGLAVGGIINKRSVFARKNYFYPGSAQGLPDLAVRNSRRRGWLNRGRVADPRRDQGRLTRAHLEEDAGKSLHEGVIRTARSTAACRHRLNRAGTPLLEIVSEPDMRSAEEAVAYAKTLH